MRYPIAILTAILCGGCGSVSAPPKPQPKASEPAKITQFYAPDTKIPKGVKGELCYGVEHAAKVELSPAVEDVWPSPTRCFEISPKENTRYTLTATGADGGKDTKTVDV